MILRSVFHMGDFGHNSCGLVFLVAESHVPAWPLEESSRTVKNGLADCTGVTWKFILDSQWVVVLSGICFNSTLKFFYRNIIKFSKFQTREVL